MIILQAPIGGEATGAVIPELGCNMGWVERPTILFHLSKTLHYRHIILHRKIASIIFLQVKKLDHLFQYSLYFLLFEPTIFK